MLRSCCFGLAAAATTGLVGVAPATAVVVTAEFAGEVVELTANEGLFGPGAVVGSPFTGRLAYEVGPTNPDQSPGDPDVGFYDLMSFEIDQSSVPLTPFAVSVVRDEPGVTLPPLPPDPGEDRLRVVATSPSYPSRLGLTLVAPFGSVFADDSLPTSLSLADFTLQTSVGGVVAVGIAPAPAIQDVGVLTSLTLSVPEPGPFALAGALALAAAAVRHRDRPKGSGQTRPR